MNRRRDLLHVSKQTEFVDWAKSQGYEEVPCKGVFECFRLAKPSKGELLIGHKRDGSDHITTTGRLTAVVQRWMNIRGTSIASGNVV